MTYFLFQLEIRIHAPIQIAVFHHHEEILVFLRMFHDNLPEQIRLVVIGDVCTGIEVLTVMKQDLGNLIDTVFRVQESN